MFDIVIPQQGQGQPRGQEVLPTSWLPELTLIGKTMLLSLGEDVNKLKQGRNLKPKNLFAPGLNKSHLGKAVSAGSRAPAGEESLGKGTGLSHLPEQDIVNNPRGFLPVLLFLFVCWFVCFPGDFWLFPLNKLAAHRQCGVIIFLG